MISLSRTLRLLLAPLPPRGRMCRPPGVGVLYPSTPTFAPLSVTPYRLKSTSKKSSGKKPGVASIGDLLDEIDDDDEEEGKMKAPDFKQTVFLETEAAKFIYNYHGVSKKSVSKAKGHRSKHQSAHQAVADYYDVSSMIRIEEYWSELQSVFEDLKNYFANHLTIRSANSLDNLPINFDGDTYPLHELASISKKDAKRLIIDCSSFPNVVSSVSKAISESNMNLSPQIDGTTLFVPIPKVTREYREKLVKGAKSTFLKAKEDYRKVQNKYISESQNFAMSPECKLPKDKQHVVEEIIRSLSHDFTHRSEELLKTKQIEILGK